MKVLVGLSGGVDSAVSAWLLKEQGYEVVAGFMKNYTSEGGFCTTYQDAQDAIKVAEFLGIEIRSYDLQKEYQDRVIDYIYAGYQKGITPNPDVLCNSLIKFDVFLERALQEGFDKIAMGHYARVESEQGTINNEQLTVSSEQFTMNNGHGTVESRQKGSCRLFRGVDHWKDQTYFLSGLNQFQLSKALFPIGHLTKAEVRELAKKIGLPNADRKDSQGLCFVGNVPIKQFLMQKFPVKPGPIKTLDGKVVGQHDGAYFFTIGQKQGLGLNFKAYVYRIDIEENVVYVGDRDIEELNVKEILVKDRHWIGEKRKVGSRLQGKIRYRQNPPVNCEILDMQDSVLTIGFDQEQRAVAPGQVFVLYDGEECLGGGIIS